MAAYQKIVFSFSLFIAIAWIQPTLQAAEALEALEAEIMLLCHQFDLAKGKPDMRQGLQDAIQQKVTELENTKKIYLPEALLSRLNGISIE